MKMQTLNDIWGANSFFSAWGQEDGFPLPWAEVEGIPQVPPENLDVLLFSEYGQRPVSPFLLRFYDLDAGTFKPNGRIDCAMCVQTLLQKQMERYVAAYAAVYNPAMNYDITEDHTGIDTDTRSFDDYTETTEFGHTVETHDNVYGFDTEAAGGVDDSRSETTYTQAAGQDGDKRILSGTQTDETEYDSTLRKYGNIGVQTVPDMLQKDFQLWDANNLWYKIAADVANLITIPIYE